MTLHMMEHRKSSPPATPHGRSSLAFIACSVMIFLAVLVTFVQGIWKPGGGLIGVYIPDSLSYVDRLESVSHELGSAPAISLLKDTFTSVVFVYLPFLLIHPSMIVVANTAMLALSIWAAAKVFGSFGWVPTMLACFAIALNPYMLVAVTGPNKEIPLSTLTLLLLSVQPSSRTSPLLLLIVALTIFIRQGYGLLLAVWVLGRLLFRGSNWIIPRRVLLLSPLAIVAFLSWLKEAVPVVAENAIRTEILSQEVGSWTLATSLASIQHPWSAIAFFGFRVFANAFSLAVRPTIFGPNGEVALLGLAYWIYGLFLALGVAGLILALVRGQKYDADHYDLARFLLFLCLGISVGLFIQPRYLLPVLAPLLGLFGTLPSRLRLAASASIFILAPVAVVILAWLGLYPGIYQEMPIKPEFFLDL